jgi:hypothetical protein
MLQQIIRKTLVASALSVPMLAMMAPKAMANKTDFRVYNDSSYDIYRLYVSESSMDTWGGDILGSDILPSGYNIQVIFGNPSPSVCYYDIRAEFSTGEVVEDYQVNVCTNDYYQFFDQ